MRVGPFSNGSQGVGLDENKRPRSHEAAASPSPLKRVAVVSSSSSSSSSCTHDEPLSPWLRALALLAPDANPDSLPHREAHVTQIQSWLQTHLDQKQSSCLFLSGVPGTGKTASLRMAHDRIAVPHDVISINCAHFEHPDALWTTLMQHMHDLSHNKGADHVIQNAHGVVSVVGHSSSSSSGGSGGGIRMDDFQSRIQAQAQSVLRRLCRRGQRPCVLLLDEVDQLFHARAGGSSLGRTVLGCILRFTLHPQAHVLVVGVANMVDLVSLMKRSQVMPKSWAPDHHTFEPYNRHQLQDIVGQRLASLRVFEPAALTVLCASVATRSGDIRQMLAAARQQVQAAAARQADATAAEASPSVAHGDTAVGASASPTTATPSDTLMTISARQVLAVRNVKHKEKMQRLPLHQQLLLIGLSVWHEVHPDQGITSVTAKRAYAIACKAAGTRLDKDTPSLVDAITSTGLVEGGGARQLLGRRRSKKRGATGLRLVVCHSDVFAEFSQHPLLKACFKRSLYASS